MLNVLHRKGLGELRTYSHWTKKINKKRPVVLYVLHRKGLGELHTYSHWTIFFWMKHWLTDFYSPIVRFWLSIVTGLASLILRLSPPQQNDDSIHERESYKKKIHEREENAWLILVLRMWRRVQNRVEKETFENYDMMTV